METFFTFPNRYDEVMFKSYYVVWKRKNHADRETKNNTFKSYYVVWKRKIKNNEKRTQQMFKSYYVVWKPGKKEILLIFCDKV